MVGVIARLLCAWYGHRDPMRKYAPGRIYLRCEACGTETPGWEIPQKVLKFETRRREAKQALRFARGARTR